MLWIGGWVCPLTDLDAVEHRKIPTSAENRTPAVKPVACRYTNWAHRLVVKVSFWLIYVHRAERIIHVVWSISQWPTIGAPLSTLVWVTACNDPRRQHRVSTNLPLEGRALRTVKKRPTPPVCISLFPKKTAAFLLYHDVWLQSYLVLI
jgi:hypothetical protein